ncbi:hypothetical protein AKJ09_00408 [Labilithrix luteola]|uniref:Uncharacterized protein n=1 Tax=Labilithrix luteola TaxID=1391654 RepID=A0A0K1PKX1_9BACT|nr:hypothetical protein AKJ09_00408 [Labilithrix luteola]
MIVGAGESFPTGGSAPAVPTINTIPTPAIAPANKIPIVFFVIAIPLRTHAVRAPFLSGLTRARPQEITRNHLLTN